MRQGRKSSGSQKKTLAISISFSEGTRLCLFLFIKNRMSIGKFYENTQRLFFYFFSKKP
jgi:hypothetical protein